MTPLVLVVSARNLIDLFGQSRVLKPCEDSTIELDGYGYRWFRVDE